ncbi:C45 family autoproteolytic acyltransferase/hydrolase [Aquimarina hainanensis]|uniref:C45 family autoproteolytic acyltransferase/hydrolase n=1 Tax=Aquimarina hainanensis TaxID=1578017 RepID=A0ABW5N4V2_9FLAO
MNKIIFLVFILLASCQCQDKKDNKTKQKTTAETVAPLEIVADGKLKILHLSGTPYERGVQHGRLLKDEIKTVTDSLLADIGRTTKEEPLTFIKRFLSKTNFVSSMKKWTPNLLEEIKGISDGSGIPHEIIFMHQLGDEFFFSTKYLFAHKCSSIGINKSNSHPTLAAQNMDIPTYFHGYQTVMNFTDETGKELMILTIPGHIGITGMNNSNVSINCNILMQLNSQSKGLPVSSIVRGVLDKNEYSEAINWIKTVKHASGQNYLIGGLHQVTSLESSANSIEEFKPYEEANFTYHTNHPLSNNDYSNWYLEALEENGFTLFDTKGFCQRLPSFEKRFNKENNEFGIEEIKEVLSSKDHDGYDVLSNTYTYASVIYVLSENPQFLIAPGKPHETAYIELKF